jgi:hypothetical protein
MNRFSLARNLALGVLALVLGGCGQRTAQVSGVVKFNGKALTSGVVAFINEKTGRGTPPAYIHTDGTYSVPLAAVGPTLVLIQTPRPIRPEGMPNDSPEVRQYEIQAASYVDIPQRYVDMKDSGVTTDLHPGSNTFDIELHE